MRSVFVAKLSKCLLSNLTNNTQFKIRLKDIIHLVLKLYLATIGKTHIGKLLSACMNLLVEPRIGHFNYAFICYPKIKKHIMRWLILRSLEPFYIIFTLPFVTKFFNQPGRFLLEFIQYLLLISN